MKILILILFLCPLFIFSQNNIITSGGNRITSGGNIVIGSGYDTDVNTFFDAVATAGGILTDDEKTRINTFVISAKSTGEWDSCQAIYPMRGDGAAAMAINLKNPGTFDGVFFNTVGGDFSADGWQANGSTSYFNTTIIPSTNLSLLSNTISIYIGDSVVENKFDLSSEDGDIQRIDMFITYASNYYASIYNNVDNNGRIIFSNVDSRGYWLQTRVANNDLRAFLNGIQQDVTSVGTTIGTLPIQDLVIGCRNSLGVKSLFSSKLFQGVVIGKGLTPTQVLNISTYFVTLNSDR